MQLPRWSQLTEKKDLLLLINDFMCQSGFPDQGSIPGLSFLGSDISRNFTSHGLKNAG